MRKADNDGLNLDDLKRSMEECGLGDVSIVPLPSFILFTMFTQGEETFGSVLKTLHPTARDLEMNSFEASSVDTTVLLNEFSPQLVTSNNNLNTNNDFIPDPSANVFDEQGRFKEYCRKQLEALTAIRQEILRDEQERLDMTDLNKFHFWNRMMQLERQKHAEQVAELKLQIRELEGKLDDVMNTIYLVLFYPFLCLNTHVGAR